MNRLLLIFLVASLFTGCSKKIQIEKESPIIVTTEPAAKPIPVDNTESVISDNFRSMPPFRSKKFIVIDPGHGGEDDGTKSLSKPIYKEKNLNLSTAKILETYLKQMGYLTAMTRTEDIFISLDQRALFANDRKADLFVSIHYNSAPSKQADGIEVFYFKTDKNKNRALSSKLLAEKILNRVILNTEAKSRGVKHGNLSVIRETNMPAVLIEGGFLTNENELDKLKNASYIKKLAWGVAQGIQDYINQGT